jgi:hypothetical protein
MQISDPAASFLTNRTLYLVIIVLRLFIALPVPNLHAERTISYFASSSGSVLSAYYYLL